MSGEHLHLIREVSPEEKDYYKIWPVMCPSCNDWVFIVHLDLPPEDPPEAP